MSAAQNQPADHSAAELLNEIRAFLSRFVVLSSEHQAVAVVLWVLHTHAIDASETTPYLAVLSAEKRSGKSRLLELLTPLAGRGRYTPNISEAALFRVLEDQRPTLLIDEIDALFRSGSERTEALRGVINAGNRRGSLVYRCEGPKSDVKGFDVFGPKVLAGIDTGALPDTIRDRSIVLRLRRKTIKNTVERLLWQDVRPQTDVLRERAEQWAAGCADVLKVARPQLPRELDDRAAEGWWPLLAIADRAGGDWPAMARAAAVALCSGDVQEDSRGVRLLADLRNVLADRNVMSTDDLLHALNGLDDASWGLWHDGKGLTARDLSRFLRPYEVRPRTVRLSGSTAKGYHRDELADAFDRYLPNPSQATHPSHPRRRATPL